MKTKLATLMVALSVVLPATQASAAELKVGYVNTQRIFRDAPTAVKAQKRIEAKSHIRDMAQAAAEKTNRISATFLRQSGEALANDAICELFHSVDAFPDTSLCARATARVLAIGSTSGADMLTGTVLALRQNIEGNVT